MRYPCSKNVAENSKFRFSPTNILVNNLHIHICIMPSDNFDNNMSMLFWDERLE